jgi:hypothetical protein
VFSRVIEIWRLFNAPCDKMAELVSRAEDERLPGVQRAAMKLHLLYCSACRRFRRQLRRLRESVRTAGDSLIQDPAEWHTGSEAVPADTSLSDDAKARIRRALNDRNV